MQLCNVVLHFQVYQDFDVMLNKTDVRKNNNKYYIIQLLTAGGKYYAWNRWGRVVSVAFSPINNAHL